MWRSTLPPGPVCIAMAEGDNFNYTPWARNFSLGADNVELSIVLLEMSNSTSCGRRELCH